MLLLRRYSINNELESTAAAISGINFVCEEKQTRKHSLYVGDSVKNSSDVPAIIAAINHKQKSYIDQIKMKKALFTSWVLYWKCLFRFYDSSPSDASFTCIIRIIILKCSLVFGFPDRTEGGGFRPVVYWFVLFGSEVRGLCTGAVRSHPVLCGLLQIRPPQGTYWMKFMVSDRGTLNTFSEWETQTRPRTHW